WMCGGPDQIDVDRLELDSGADVGRAELAEFLRQRAQYCGQLAALDDEVEVLGGARFSDQPDRMRTDQRPVRAARFERFDDLLDVRFAHRPGSSLTTTRLAEQRTVGREDPHRAPDRLGDCGRGHPVTISLVESPSAWYRGRRLRNLGRPRAASAHRRDAS